MKRLLILSSIGLLAVFYLTSGKTNVVAQGPLAISRLNSAAHPLQVARQTVSHPHARNHKQEIDPDSTGPWSASLKLPLDFEVNRGQAAKSYAFVAHGPAYALGLSSQEIALSLNRPRARDQASPLPAALDFGAKQQTVPTDHSQIHLRLLGANGKSPVTGLDPKPGVSNYFIGNDPSRWQTHVPHFGRVKMDAVYPGIDLVFYGNPQQLEYDFQLAPEADPQAIRLNASDAVSTRLDSDGDLVLATAAGDVRLRRPDAYQEIDGTHRSVESRFRLVAGNVVQFEIGTYDHAKPLIIDPVLTYGLAIGGSDGNQAEGMDIDSTGDAYITGNSCSLDFPTTATNTQSHPDITNTFCQEAFVLKLDPTASSLIYSDFVGGGSGASSGLHVAVDSTGDAFVTGATNATDFPLVSNIGPSAPAHCPLVTAGNNCPDGFILELNPDGSSMTFSSLLGGSQASGGLQVKLNPVTGDVVVVGATNSSDFQPQPNTFETTYAGGTCVNDAGIAIAATTPCFNGFLLGLNPATGALRYGTFLGSANSSWAMGLAFDTDGNAYVAGNTIPPLSSSFGPVTNTYAPVSGTSTVNKIFVAQLKLAESTLSLGYLTLIEGNGTDMLGGIAVDSSDNVYLTGSTTSTNLPVTPGVFQSTNSAAGDASCLGIQVAAAFLPLPCGTAFVGKLNSAGALSFFTYLGGSTADWGEAIAIDSIGNLWIAGNTSSSDFPFSTTAGDSAFNNTPFLAEMSGEGTSLPFASPIASDLGQASDLRIDSSNNIYVAGFASSAPSTPGTYPTDPEIQGPMFAQKWSAGSPPGIELSTNSMSFPNTVVGAVSAPQIVTVTNTGTGTLQLAIHLTSSATGLGAGVPSSSFLQTNNCGSSLAASASCTITVLFEPVAPSSSPCTTANGCYPESLTADLLVQTNTVSGTQKVTLSGTLGQGPVVSAIPNPIVFPAQIAGTTSQQVQVNVYNMGDLNLLTSNISIGGTNSSEFQVTEGPGSESCTNPVIPGYTSSCVLYVTFSPAVSATGTRTATLNFTDNAVDSPQAIPLSGTIAASGPDLVISPTSAMLGPSVIGATVNLADCFCAFIDMANASSTASIEVTALTIGGANENDFQVDPYPPLPVTIAPGDNTSFEVYFQPSSGSDGLRTGTLTVTTSPSITGLPVIQLQGKAVTNSDPSLYYFSNPSQLDFGSMQVGQSSASGSNFLQIDNQKPDPCGGGVSTCGGPLTITSIVSGLSDYTLSVTPYSSTNSFCTLPPLTIPTGNGCDFLVTFSPSQAGSRNTTLTIKSNDPLGTATVPLMGTGLALPLGNLSVTALNFGYDAIGVASPQLTATLQNTGAGSLSISGATASANFAVASNTCTGTVASGASCIIGVTFTPPAAGEFSGTLTVSDNNTLNGQQEVALSGIGAAGASLLITPNSLNLGNTVVNNISPAQAITVYNSGDTAVTFATNAFQASTGFIVQSTTCGGSLAVGGSCMVNIKFKPSTAADESGTLSITDNARGNPQTINLIGIGIQSGSNNTTTSLTSSANPVTSGQSITFTATVSGTTTNTPVPTGSVTFLDGTATLGAGTLNGSAQATFTTSTLSTGSHSITAVYSSDANYAASTSPVLTEVVNAPTPVATKTTLTASPTTATVGETVTLTATVAETGGSGVPTGTVTFYDGTTSLGIGTVSAGTAIYSTTSLAAGSHSITASYSGDANNASSTSAIVSVTITSPAPLVTTTTLTSSSASIASGSSVTFTATVAPPSGTTTMPTGTVTFLNGTTTLGAQTLNVGTATYTTTSLPIGTNSITAQYGGDTDFASSTSAAVIVLVGTPAFSLSLSPGSVSVAGGSSANTTVTATPVFGFASAISFACSGLPQYANCTFNPATVTPSGSTAATTTLTIATNVSTASLQKDSTTPRPRERAPLLCLVLLGAFSLLRARRKHHALLSGARNLCVLVILLVALVSGALMGCGGSGSSKKTPPGTTTVTITASGGGQTQTATLSVTVQ